MTADGHGSLQDYIDGLLAAVDREPYVRRTGNHVRGEQHPRARLCESQVLEIRRRLAAGESMKGLAREFQVGSATVYRIGRGLSWRHLIDDPTAAAAGQPSQEQDMS